MEIMIKDETIKREIARQKKITFIAIIILTVCSLFMGLAKQEILSFIVVFCFLLLFIIGKTYLAYPYVIFYYGLYPNIFDISVYRIFTLILMFSVLFNNKHNRFNKEYLIPLLIYCFYSLLVISEIDLQKSIFVLVDIICCLFIILNYLQRSERIVENFFYIYVLVSFCAFFTGLIGGNFLILEQYGVSNDVVRFLATFEDSNYMGYFYTIAIFATVSLRLFNLRLRLIIIIALYLMVFMSASMSAILINIILWFFYLFIIKKLRLRYLIIFIVVLFALLVIYQYGVSNPDSPVFGTVSYRIKNKIDAFKVGDMDVVTTGRSEHMSEHLEYFSNLPILKQLFGGTSATSFYVDPVLKKLAHNEYVDWLLNIGVIGSLFMSGFILYRTFKFIKKYKEEKSNVYLCFTMVKAIWLCYAMTLTIFMDYRFMFAFLL